MKRFAVVSCAALAALVLCRFASAQGNAGNLNDLRLHNEGDVHFSYSGGVTTPGPFAGQASGPPWTSNIYFWKVWSRDTLRYCNGFMEISGVEVSQFDSDWFTVSGGNNTASPDWWWSEQDSAGPQGGPPNSPVGTILPDQATGLYISAPITIPPDVNNDFLPPPPCPGTPGVITGYDIQYDMTGGLGPSFGIPIPADGTKDFVWTVFVPGGQKDTGSNACTSFNGNNKGDYSYVDFHSTDTGANPSDGETGFDWLGTGESAFGGSYNPSTATGVMDDVAEINCNAIQFTEPVIAMNVNSNTGHVDPGPAAGLIMDVPGVAETQLEEGLAGIHYRLSPAAGGKLSARYYSWQDMGRPTIIYGAASTLPCVNFKGARLGVNIADFIGKFFATGIWFSAGGPHLTDNQYVWGGTDFDDATFRPFPLPLPSAGASGLPPNTVFKMYFQAFSKKPASGLLDCSQITTLYLHNP